MTRAFGAVAWGTELSPARRDYCLQLGIEVVADDALPDGGFDFINADQVFEHLPQPRETLGLLVKKLRPGGILRIAVPNGLGIERALRRFDRELARPVLGALNPVAPLEHLNCFRTRALVRLAASHGLRRVIPPWKMLLAAMYFPPGAARKAKAMARPFYLRSGIATQLFFARAL
jgi:SAM-dependent methyltransferase